MAGKMIASRSALFALLLASALIFGACGDDHGAETQATAISASASPALTESGPTASGSITEFSIKTFALPAGSRPHDVAPAADGGVWYTAQRRAALGWLDPASGEVREIPLGEGSAPHGVIVGP